MIKKSRNLNLNIGAEYLHREHVYKYLGIYLDSHLNFNKHIDYVTKITSHTTFLLAKIRNLIDQITALYIFKSMIMPIFDYGDIIYEGGTQIKLLKLQRIQNRGLKICLSIKERIRTINLHQQASVPQLFVRRCSNLKKYMFLQQNNPRYRIDRPIVTRAHDASVLETCIPKIEKYKKCCMYRGISLWNSLTVAERNIETYKLFKLSQYNWRSDVTKAGLQQI